MYTQLFEGLLMAWGIASAYVALSSTISGSKNRLEELAWRIFGSPVIVAIVAILVIPLMCRDAICKIAPTWKLRAARPLWQWAVIAAVFCATAGIVFGLSR